MIYNLVTVTRTCVAAPSQWEAIDDKGNNLYLRYRHGVMRVHLMNETNDEYLGGYEKSLLEYKTIGDNSYMNIKNFIQYSDVLTLDDNYQFIDKGE